MEDPRLEPPVISLASEIAQPATAKKKRKKKKKKTKGLYDLYLADSGSEECSQGSSEEEEVLTLYNDVFTVGADINILIHQTVQNVIQSVCLEDPDNLGVFGDAELRCFAAAVRHNSSILSVQIRYLDVSDHSLVALCAALTEHPSVRALDLSGTHGSDATSRALRDLVCSNSNIIFARLDDTICNVRDREIIEEACRYNTFVCPDPSSNPFQLGLLREISAMEEKDKSLHEQLQARPWLLSEGAHPNYVDEAKQKKGKKKVTIAAKHNIGAEVCPQFISGSCAYGSRCKYYHPERTTALKNATTSSQHARQDALVSAAASNVNHDTVSLGGMSHYSTATSTARKRLQSRLRPSKFTFRPNLCYKDVQEEEWEERDSEGSDSGSESDADERRRGSGLSVAQTALVWSTVASVVGCCCTLVLYL